MNTNMAGFKWFSNFLHPCALDKSSLSIRRVDSGQCRQSNSTGLGYRSTTSPRLNCRVKTAWMAVASWGTSGEKGDC